MRCVLVPHHRRGRSLVGSISKRMDTIVYSFKTGSNMFEVG